MSNIIRTWEKESKLELCDRPSCNVLTPEVEEVIKSTSLLTKEIISNFEKANVLDNGIYWRCPLVHLIEMLENFNETCVVPEIAIHEL